MLKFRKKDEIYLLIVFAFTLSLFLIKGVFDFLFTKNFAGVDLVGNFSLVWLMNKLLSQFRIIGWTNLWFSGMPVFTFYPPLFFIVTAILSKISFGLISLKMSYKIVIFLSLLFLPVTGYFSSRRMGFKQKESSFIGLWFIPFLFIDRIFGGINQTLNYGLVAQMFSLNLLLLFIGELFNSFESKKKLFFASLLPGFLLSLIILSHVYVTTFALISLMIFSLVHFSKRSIKFGLIVLVIGLSLSSFWWLPTLININYAQPYGWNPMDVPQFSMILIFFSLFVFLDFKIKDFKKTFLIILFLVLFFIGTQGLPFPKIQYDRFFFASFVFGSFLAGIGNYNLYNFLSRKIFKKSKLPILIFLIPIAIALLLPLNKEWKSDLEIDNLLKWIRENVNDGIILVESFSGKERYVLTERIPIETGKPTLAETHIDSSSISPDVSLLTYEMFGKPFSIYCEYCSNATVHPDKETILKKLETFNVKYIIVYTEENKDYLDDFLMLKDKVDGFYIFEVP